MVIKKPTEAQITLRKLLETCQDSQKAFKTAESAVAEGAFKDALGKWAEEREQFCTQLTNLMTILNTDPLFYQFEEGSVAGFLQRAWMNFASAVSSQDELAIIKACETGEAWSRSVYEEAVKADLPDEVLTVVREQFASVASVQDSLKYFRSQTAGR